MPRSDQYGTSVSWCQYQRRRFCWPPKKDTEAINLRLPRELIEALDDRRRIEADLPTRPEMIRRALVQWLELTAAK